MLRVVGPSIRRQTIGFQRHQFRGFWSDPHAVISTFTESLQSVHNYSGIPWWLLIPISTFTLRSVWTLPLAILQRKRLQKQSEFRPIISAMNPVLKVNLAKKVKQAQSNKSKSSSFVTDPLASMKYEELIVLTTKETRSRQKKLFKQHSIQLWKNFILPTFQVPLWIIMSLTMRDLSGWTTWDKMSNKPLDTSLYTEGIGWITDLTVADNYHILPLIIGITALTNVEWTFKTIELLRQTQRKKLRITLTDALSNISRMSVVFLMAIAPHAPAALCLYWLSSQVFSLIQNVILDLTMPISFTPHKRLNYRALTLADAVPLVRNVNM